MSQQDTLRKVIASAVIAGVFAISAVTGGSASADGGVIGASQAITVGSSQTETYAPGLTKYPVVKLQRVGAASEPPTELVTFVFHEIK